MTKRIIKRTRPYQCTICGGDGIDPRARPTNGRELLPCKTCNGTGILQIDELETWDDGADK